MVWCAAYIEKGPLCSHSSSPLQRSFKLAVCCYQLILSGHRLLQSFSWGPITKTWRYNDGCALWGQMLLKRIPTVSTKRSSRKLHWPLNCEPCIGQNEAAQDLVELGGRIDCNTERLLEFPERINANVKEASGFV